MTMTDILFCLAMGFIVIVGPLVVAALHIGVGGALLGGMIYSVRQIWDGIVSGYGDG
jgi:hypothetical protein